MNHRYAMQIVGLVSGGVTPFDGEFVKEYDPNRDGVDPNGDPMLAHIVTTPDISEAIHMTFVEFHELWTKVDERTPIRPDGKPNRPLTAFTVTTVRVS